MAMTPDASCSSPFSCDATVRRRACQPGWNEPSTALCHSPRRRPGRRRRRTCWSQNTTASARFSGTKPWMSMHYCWVMILLCAVLFGTARAEGLQGHRGASLLDGQMELLLDRSPIPEPRAMLSKRVHQHAEQHLARRDDGDGELQLDHSGSQTTLPRPFDSNIGNNFTTDSCPTFFNNFLNNQSFIDCLPLSLLLQTSNSFFAATRSLPTLTATLDATCNVPSYPQCAALMSSLATQLTSPTNCGADYALSNPTVAQAQAGLLAYAPLYHAGCLKNPSSTTSNSEAEYCFASAVTNRSAPASSYIYYLPLGVALPGGTQVTCNSCLQRTMAVFGTYAVDSAQPLYQDFGSAAEMVDETCGPHFVNISGPVAAATGAGERVGLGVGWWGVLVLGLRWTLLW